MGKPETAQGTSRWYLIAPRGMVRVRQGMRLGETAAGELSFDPSCAHLEIDAAGNGGLVLSAVDDHELESPAGRHRRRERLTRYRRAEIRLAHNIVQLEPDCGDQVQVTKTVELRVVRPNDVAEAQVGRVSGDSLHLDGRTAFLRYAERRSNARARRTAATRVEPKLGVPQSPLTRSDPHPDEQLAGVASVPRRTERTNRRSVQSPRTALLIGLIGVGIVLLYPVLREAAGPGSHVIVDGGGTQQTSPPRPGPAQAHAAVVESSKRDEAGAAAPLPQPAPPEAVAGSSAEPAPKSQPAPARNDVARNDKVTPAGAEKRARAKPAKTELAGRRALVEANQALVDGRLTTPRETSAYTLYSRVLAVDPESAEAKRGLQSVRQGVVNRALAELAGSRLDDARRTLKTAAEVGADPRLLAHLQNEVDDRQRLAVEHGQ